MKEPCHVCGAKNLCCIVRVDQAGKPRSYCCQHVPRQQPDLMGSDLISPNKCEVENPLCPFSHHHVPQKEIPK